MRSIELTFDGAAEASVRADWDRLAGAGLPSLASHTAPSNSPHITLAAGDSLAIPPGAPRLWTGLPLDVRLGGLVLFPAGKGKYVLARLVVGTAGLLDLHAGLHRHATGALPLTLPGAWTPHVTLARRIPAGSLGAAVGLLDATLEARCTAARLWDSTTHSITALDNRPTA